MLCGAALTLIRMALIIWLLAPADWFTPSTPLPLLKELPPMELVAFIERSAGVVIFCVMLPVADASVDLIISNCVINLVADKLNISKHTVYLYIRQRKQGEDENE